MGYIGLAPTGERKRARCSSDNGNVTMHGHVYAQPTRRHKRARDMSGSSSAPPKVPIVVACGKKRLRARVAPSKLTLSTLTRVASKHFKRCSGSGALAPTLVHFSTYNKLNGRRRRIRTQAQLDRLQTKLEKHDGHLQADAAETICAELRCATPERTFAANMVCSGGSEDEAWVYIGIVGLAAVQAAAALVETASHHGGCDSDGDDVENFAEEDAAWVCAMTDLFDALSASKRIATEGLDGAPAAIARTVELVRGPPARWDAAAVTEAAFETAETIDDFLAKAGAPLRYNVSLFKEYLDEKDLWANSSNSTPFLSTEYSGLFPAFFGSR